MAAAVSAHRYTSSMAASHPIQDDELCDLFAQDTFSLESNRDRDLLLMASFLQGALPQSSSPPNGPGHQQQAGAQWIGGGPATSSFASGSGTSAAQWNGWRPDASTTTYSGSYPSAPPAPSSSYAKEQAAFSAINNFGTAAAGASGFGAAPSSSSSSYLPPAPPPQTPHGTPMSFHHPSLPPTSPELNRYGTRSSTRAQLQQQQQQQQFAPHQLNTSGGCRAPAVSRERAPMGRRSSSLGGGLPTAYEAGGPPEEDQGMDCGEDAAMEEEESYSGRSGERYAYGNGWAGP